LNQKHRFIYKLLRPLDILFTKCVFGYRFRKASGLPENYIVLSNHATDFDPLLVCTSFKEQMYFVASEHIARWPVAGPLLNYLVAPIYRNKGASAASAVMDILRHLRRGENVCMFAEGARTWDGVTGPILPSTAKVVKSAGCGLVTYRIQGGYFVSPRWGGASIRRGRIQGQPVNVYTKEQLAAMSVEEIHAAITADLYEDAYARQLEDPTPYRSRKGAEQLEKLLFICPECGQMDCFHSAKDTVTCGSCGLEFRYDAYGMLQGAPFSTVKELAQWQNRKILDDIAAGTVYTAANGTLYAVQKHDQTLLTQGPISMSTDCLKCGDFEIPLKEINDLNIHGRKGLVFTANRQYYELIPDPGCNALKFHLYFHGCKESLKEKVG